MRTPAGAGLFAAWLLLGGPAAGQPIFTEEAAADGLDFVHFNGMSGRYYFAEVVGAGAAVFDYDGDGDLDVVLVQGRMLGPDSMIGEAVFPPREPLPLRDRLFRNDLAIEPDGRRRLRFTDVTAASGLDAREYGMGVAAADYDNDGDVDLYLSNFGPNQLWQNQGDGTFREVTRAAGVGEERWSVAVSWLDFDRDGWLDLFVGNYLAFTLDRNKACIGESGLRDYCGPQSYAAQPDRLFRNRGDGTFEDVTEKAGLAAAFGPALGAVAADFDGDGWIDLYVANDQAANQLWLNQKDGTFRDDALLLGCAVNRDGEAEASMGVDAADFDGDGDEDLFMTHLTRESNTLFVNDGHGIFRDQTLEAGLAAPSWKRTSFGTAWIDYDNDGVLDLLIANGAVYVIFELMREGDPFPLHQPNQLFHGLGGGRFEEVASGSAGPPFALSEVSRGAAFGDLDNDGDPDVVVTQNSGPVRLLRNQVGQDRHWLGLRLVAGDPPRDQLGARAAVHVPGRPPLWRRVRTDGSYASSNDPRIVVGLGDAAVVEKVVVTWPDGAVETWTGLAIDRYTTLARGASRSSGEPP